MNIIANISCIKFEELYEPFIEDHYVVIQPGNGCASSIGNHIEINLSLCNLILIIKGYRPGENNIYLNETVNIYALLISHLMMVVSIFRSAC